MSIKKQSLPDLLAGIIFTRKVFVSAMTVTVFLFFYAFAFSLILPQGINHVFVTRLCRWLLALGATVCVVFFMRFHRSKQEDLKHANSAEGLYVKDLFLLLLPMTPIVRYIILNRDILSAFDSVAVFFIFLFVSFVLSFLAPLVFGRIGSKKFLMMGGLSFSYMLFNMASLASDFGWHLFGSFKMQFVLLAAFFTIFLVFYSLDKKFLNIAAAVFFAGSILAALVSPNAIENKINKLIVAGDAPSIYAYTHGKEMKRKPDIFLLTYDSYVENETMLKYGVDNSAQEDYLIESGFHIYRGTYSVGSLSLLSMGRVLNIQGRPHIGPSLPGLISVVSTKIDARKHVSISATSGDGAVQNILRENGYKTLGIFPMFYFFREVGSSYDQTFPAPTLRVAPYWLLARSIFEGEFRFNAGFDKIAHSDYLSKKRAMMASRAKEPRFLYTHTDLPGHSQLSGSALGNEAELFQKRLVKANEEMKEDIGTIKKYNPNAIIIVNGDHGPHLTKNCASTSQNNQYNKSEIDQFDMQDRYGSFLAIKWPEDAHIDHGKIKILQDMFPSVFAYLFDDASILNSRIERLTLDANRTSGVRVRDGVIEGGKDDGKSLFGPH